MKKKMELKTLEEALRKSWGRDTAYPETSHNWTPGCPEYGQCAVTSLIVQDYHGGEIAFHRGYYHFWNVIDGKEVDLTRDQFPKDMLEYHPLNIDRVRSREEIIDVDKSRGAKTRERYELLKKRVEECLNKTFLS